MGPVLGDLLPLAVGVAISPVPIIAVILMLLAPRAGAASAGFLAGWLAGIAVACTVFVVLSSMLDLGGQEEPSTTAAWIQLVLGALLVLLGVRQWRGRPRCGAEAVAPKWMRAIDSFTAVKATGLGFALAAVNPKNLLLAAAAGSAVAGGDLSTGDDIIAVAVFTVLAGSTVAVPVLAHAVARERMSRPLEDLKSWLVDHNAAVMTALLVVIGADLVGKGLGALV